jgi:Uri superfamily endonuclease
MENNKQHWHLDKKLNIGHLLTTITMVIGMFVYLNNIEQKVAENTSQVAFNKERIEKTDANVEKAVNKIEANLEKIIEILKDRK